VDKAEKLIKQYLAQKQSFGKGGRSNNCPDPQVLLEYLAGLLDVQLCQELEHHIAGCGFCLGQLSIVFEAQRPSQLKQGQSLSPSLLAKTRMALGIVGPVKNDAGHKNKATRRRLFLGGTVLFFILSFVIPRYFFQFLAAALILGIRWSFESESGRTMIMILDSWRRHSRDEDDEISRRLKKRF